MFAERRPPLHGVAQKGPFVLGASIFDIAADEHRTADGSAAAENADICTRS